jgi:hypothetical protein
MKFVLIYSFLFLLISSCCTKKHCIDAEENNVVEFHGFLDSDLDSVIIHSYENGSSFVLALDSQFVQADPSGNYFIVYLQEFSLINDYKISLPKTGQVFLLSNFETEKKACNDCIPFRPKSEYYNRINSYNLNGVLKNDFRIRIQ